VPESIPAAYHQDIDIALLNLTLIRRLARVAIPVIFNQTVDDHGAAFHAGRMTRALDATFAALADPTRRAILTMLLEDDMAVTDVAEPFQMSLAAISKHLTVLSVARLIIRERRGRVIWCKLDPDALRAASIWMQGFGQFDPVDLDDFERFLAAELDPGIDTAP
jgi:DNA-binding transcriptional ArsR family regulator